ncbi:hypothetical protein HMPREF1128_1691 [Haemophilus sputorum HK 2154]|nr:hypothetical protein HMPREF1128_1691 [Haemophilus sputorum HK 2154]
MLSCALFLAKFLCNEWLFNETIRLADSQNIAGENIKFSSK